MSIWADRSDHAEVRRWAQKQGEMDGRVYVWARGGIAHEVFEMYDKAHSLAVDPTSGRRMSMFPVALKDGTRVELWVPIDLTAEEAKRLWRVIETAREAGNEVDAGGERRP